MTMTQSNIISGIKWGLLAFGLIFTLIFIHDNLLHESDRYIIKLEDLNEGVNYPICTASVDSQALLCDDPEDRWIQPLYNLSQEQLDKILDTCEDAKIVSAPHCIGELLYVVGEGK